MMPGRFDAVAVIPAYNEARAIADVVHEVLGRGLPVIVADDASDDDTARMAREAGAHVLHLPFRMGAWNAAQAGLQYALCRGASHIVTLDADGQHRAADIPLLLHPVLRGEADMSIGSCPGRGSPARRLAWWVFRKITGLHTADLTSGFRAYNRKAARTALHREAVLADFQDIGILLLARRYRLRLRDVPVVMRPRANGKSHVFSSWARVAYYMGYTFIIACARR